MIADHAHLHLALEDARGLAARGEDRGAVGVRVGVDELDRVRERVDAHDGQHRAEDLVAVDAHVGRDVVEQRRADQEAVPVALEPAPVDDRVGAGVDALVDVADDPVARLRRDHRAHLRVGLEARADLDRQRLLAQPLDQRVGGVADRDGDRDRHAALAGRAVARGGQVVGGEVEVGVGQHDGVVLGAAQRLHALAVLRAGLVDVACDRRRADERDGGHAGWSSSASTATLSPCTTLNTPSGRPASW